MEAKSELVLILELIAAVTGLGIFIAQNAEALPDEALEQLRKAQEILDRSRKLI